jgi:hypothetical protein
MEMLSPFQTNSMSKTDHHKQLNKFVGKWNTSGRIPSTDKTPEVEVKGTDTYEWLPGEFFLLHKVDVHIGDERNQTLEVIGFDTQPNEYTMQYYDNKGESGKMKASIKKDIWTFENDKLRFTGTFKDNDNEFSGTWEQSENATTWTKMMDINLVKA